MNFVAKLVAGGAVAGLFAGCATAPAPDSAPTARRVVVMVWDGLRPDSVNSTDTPNLYAMRQAGVNFSDNHSTYPTFTMLNGSSFATGSFPRTSGFYGNTFWTPPRASNAIPTGPSAAGTPQDYVAPVFTEDYQVLATLNDYYGGQLLLVKSLFATAQAAGLVTATVGKSGAAYIQDLGKGGYFIDENTVQPRSLVSELQAAGIALPVNTVKGYTDADAVTLASNNGNPTARAGYLTFNTAAYDPQGKLTVAARDSADARQGAPEASANQYMMSVFTRYILPKKKPMLSLIWFRTPDNVEHGYGPGTPNAIAGLRSQDERLGELLAALRANDMDRSTDVIVVSDHGHSSVSGPVALYPLRSIVAAGGAADGPTVNGSPSGTTRSELGSVAASGGFSFSGDVRSADLLTFRGFKAYDGAGCSTSAMYGLDASARPTLPVRLDASGVLCGAANTKYQAISATLPVPVASFKVPAPGSLPAQGIVIAANGGSDYFYLPGHDNATVAALVKVLQQREEYGAIFVDSRYGMLPGTLPLSAVNLENTRRRGDGQPDVVASFAWDADTAIQGLAGIEFESAAGQRGMHGSFGRSDVHNTLIARGPSFKTSTVISTPSGNVDLAPTAAHLLGLSMPQADGRVLDEGLANPTRADAPVVKASIVSPTAPALGLHFELPTDLTGATLDPALRVGSYTIDLAVKDLTIGGKTYRYFDSAKAVRR
jgi:arylsulfatase A-like enzyme